MTESLNKPYIHGQQKCLHRSGNSVSSSLRFLSGFIFFYSPCMSFILRFFLIFLLFCYHFINTVTCMSYTDVVWIANWIDWVLWYRAWRTHTHTHTHKCPQSRLHCRCLVAALNGGRSLSSVFSNCPGLSYQLLTAITHNDWTSAVL
jgi:hypothetical protein